MDIQKKPTLAEKQAFWVEQLPNFEAKYWLSDRAELLVFDMEQGNYVVKDGLDPIYKDDANDTFHRVNTGWAMWKKAITFCREAQKVAVPDGFAVIDVLAERKRQIEQEHYSHEHDDEYDQNELLRAASSYLNHVVGRRWVCKSESFGVDVYQSEGAPDLWPWGPDFWKPKDPRRDLVRAAALIIAEIEKINRSTGAES